MKKRLLLFIIPMLMFCGKSMAQEEGQLLFNAGADVYRTPAPDDLLSRYFFGVDANYFIADKFALGLGYEVSDVRSPRYAFGARLYPFSKLFVRSRALFPGNFSSINLDLGLGYDIMLSDTWAVEISGDYYLGNSYADETIGARLGLTAFL